MLAATSLRAKGLNIAILNVHTIKPLDTETLETYARKSKNLVTIEDHSIIGGLGSAVCEFLAEAYPCRVLRIGLNDEFPESAPPSDLYEKYGLNSSGILKKTREFISKNEN